MTERSPLDKLRTDIDYTNLVAKSSPALQLYIRTLEQENAQLRQELSELKQAAARRARVAGREQREPGPPAQVKTVEHPEEMMVVSVTTLGQCKRTPLNAYSTQRRGGVGVLDIVSSRDDLVAHLLATRESASLLVLTDRGRAFRVPVDSLPLTEIRARGTSLPARLGLGVSESLAALAALDDEEAGLNYVLIATAKGWVHRLRRNYVGARMQPGTQLYDPQRGGGAPTAMTLSPGDADLLLALRSGMGIRFAESLVRRDGVRGIQVKPKDVVAGITGIGAEGDAFLVTADGKGTRRPMSAFRANKSAGGQGKGLMKTEILVGVAAVSEDDEILCISNYAKIIRFAASEVPPKTGTVQGNSVMDCRDNRLAAFCMVPTP